jgi:hypothetical protein
MIVAFDIGGVLSRYPEKMKALMHALMAGGVDVRIVTDINHSKAIELLHLNGFGFVPDEKVHSGDWSVDGDLCKTNVCTEIGVDFLIDDRPDYCAEGDFIGMVLSPRPRVSYYAKTWMNGPI